MTRHGPQPAAPAREATAQAGGTLRQRVLRLLRFFTCVGVLWGVLQVLEFAATHAALWFSGVGGWALAALLCVPVFGALGLVYGWLLDGSDDLYQAVIPSSIVVVFFSLMGTDSPLSSGPGLLLGGAVIVTALVLGQLLAGRWRTPGARAVPEDTSG